MGERCDGLLRDYDLNAAFAPQYIDPNIRFMSFKREVNYSISYPEMLNLYVVQEGRQDRLRKRKAGARSLNSQTETGLEKQEQGDRGPGLRTTGDRVQRGAFTGAAREPAQQFRQPMQLEKEAGIEETTENLQCAFFESVGGHAGCDERIVVRPDRSIVVRHWVEAGLGGGDGADTPSVKKLFAD